MLQVRASITLVSVLFFCRFLSGQPHKVGVFYGTLQFERLADGQHYKVLQMYTYVDAEGHTLGAQPGFVTDGTSIPRPFWSIVGSPFTGTYVAAAVIHDVGCETHKYSWQVTHRMFYDAMLDSGVSEHLAKVMYYSVRLGGPRWKNVKLSAKTTSELGEKIAQSGAISVTETSGITHTNQTKTATVIVLLSRRKVVTGDIRLFEDELNAKEIAGGTISIEDIESRTDASSETLLIGPK